MYTGKKGKVVDKNTLASPETVTLTQLDEKDSMTQPTSLDRELFTILLNIQEKLNSPVFNGGFERLAASIEDIKESQKKTEEHITIIDKTIYEPDEGLFSRIKTVEKNHSQELIAMKSRVESLEKFQANVHKALWYVIPACGVGLVKVVWDIVSTHIVLK